MPDPTAQPAATPPPTLRCPRCRHELTGIPGSDARPDSPGLITCPECGTPTTLMAAGAVPAGDRGWGYFGLWMLSATTGLLLLACVIGILLSVVLAAAGSGP